MPATRNALGRLLQERRTQLGYSRAGAADAVGISAGTLEGWEIGRVAKPPLIDVLRLARFLSIPLETIEEAALAGSVDGQEEAHARTAAIGRRLAGTARLLEEAIGVMGWTEAEAADALQTTPERIEAWRRRSSPLPIVAVLTLTTLVAVRLADELRLSPVEPAPGP